MNPPPRRLRLSYGRALSWVECGCPTGPVLLYFHGAPGSALEAMVLDEAARAQGVRVVAPDRPGIAGSDPEPGRTVGDWVPVVEELARALDLTEVAVLAWSGGSPYALACARARPDLVRAVGLVAPLTERENWLTRLERVSARPWLATVRVLTRVSPALIAGAFRLGGGGPRSALLAASLTRALQPGSTGAATDLAVLGRAPQPGPIPQPVTIWAGGRDAYISARQVVSLARRLGQARVRFIARATHAQLLVDHTDEIVAAIRGPNWGLNVN